MVDPSYYQRERYQTPEHWVLDPNSLVGTVYYSYVRHVARTWPRGGTRILDVGCGDGYVSSRIREAEGPGAELVGVDYSERALGYARQHVPDMQLFARDLTDAAWTDGLPTGFNRVLMVEVLEHLDPGTHARLLGQVRGLMRSDGVLVATVPSVRVPRNETAHYKHFELEGFLDLLAGSGFRIRQMWGLNGYGPVARRWRAIMRRLDPDRRPKRFGGLWSLAQRLGRIFYGIFFARAGLSRAGMFLVHAVPE